jgi:hypothetical protein
MKRRASLLGSAAVTGPLVARAITQNVAGILRSSCALEHFGARTVTAVIFGTKVPSLKAQMIHATVA